MNRDFRFRAWHKGAEEMLQSRQQGYQGNVFAWLAEGQPVEIMQYTGLKDKNGKEIYESDIVYIAGSGNCRVEWDEDFAGWVFNNGSGGEDYQGILEDLEHIIGNIHENPELLEEAI